MAIDGSFKLPIRSASELVLSRPRRQVLWSDHLPISRGKTSINLNLNSSNQNLLALPAVQRFERQSSTYSDGDASDLSSFTNDGDSSEETDFETIRRNSFQESIEKTRNVIYHRPYSTHLPVLSTSDEPSKLLPPIVAVIPPEDWIVHVYCLGITSLVLLVANPSKFESNISIWTLSKRLFFRTVIKKRVSFGF